MWHLSSSWCFAQYCSTQALLLGSRIFFVQSCPSCGVYMCRAPGPSFTCVPDPAPDPALLGTDPEPAFEPAAEPCPLCGPIGGTNGARASAITSLRLAVSTTSTLSL